MATKMQNGESLFDVWMKEESATIQALAKAHGERICFEQVMEQMKRTPEVAPILNDVAVIYALACIESDLGWYLSLSHISLKVGQVFSETFAKRIRALSPQALTLVDAFAIPEWLIRAPIALDWTKFNKDDNQGELLQSRL